MVNIIFQYNHIRPLLGIILLLRYTISCINLQVPGNDSFLLNITSIFESNYVGKVNNNEDGRALLKGALADYFATLQNMGAIQNFDTDDVTVAAGTDSDAVVITAAIQPVDSVEKIYITVNLS